MKDDEDSSKVEWYLVEDGSIRVQSENILDCIEGRERDSQRITDTPP